MPDQSHLDRKYFIDRTIFNCPFCNRRHVTYAFTNYYSFDWTENKKCYIYFAECFSCEKMSMHLSFTNLPVIHVLTSGNTFYYRFSEFHQWGEKEIDEYFFFSVPTSFFVLDSRVPRPLRELITETEGCLKSNFLTGASACARKVVYELGVLWKATGDNYEERIKSLKAIHQNVDPTFFDTLLTIQQVTSSKVHEESHDGWESKHLRLILTALTEVLHEIYVLPAIREEKRVSILKLKDEVIGSKGKSSQSGKP